MTIEGTIKFAQDRNLFGIEADPDVMMRLRRILPRAESRGKIITLTATAETCRELEWICQRWNLQLVGDAKQVVADGANQHRQQTQTRLEILEGKRLHIDGMMEPSRPPRDYQLQAADLAANQGFLLLGDDLGLGKTMSCILTLRDPARLPALVVCPTHLPKQWQKEIANTLPLLNTHIITKGQPYDITKRCKGNTPDVLIMSYSKLRGWGDHLQSKMQTVIFDEAQELRTGPPTQKYLAAAQIAETAGLVVGATATPVYNYGGEVFNIFNVLRPGFLGTKHEFFTEWGSPYDYGEKGRVKDPRALGLHLSKEGAFLRRTRQDVGRELPDVIKIHQNVDVDNATYEQLQAGTLDLAKIITSTESDNQARWEASGRLESKLRQATGISKAPYVAEFCKLLLESEQKIVLFGWHRAVYDIWQNRLCDYLPVFYTGTESPAQKNEAVDRFVEGNSRIFIASLRAGAGLDGLQQVSNTCVFGELDWSPGMHDQCVGRLNRDGQIGGTVAYYLVSDTGCDPQIAEVLAEKRAQADPLRDPRQEVFAAQADNSNRVKEMAAMVLKKNEGKLI